MPRRYWSYLPTDDVTWMNQISTVGSMILALSMLPFLLNVWITHRRGVQVTVDDPWGNARSLEWATSCPPPRHNFTSIPRIRSESPAFDLHHPEVAMLEYDHNNGLDSSDDGVADAPDVDGREEMLRERTEGDEQ